jgi:hypothetical protein
MRWLDGSLLRTIALCLVLVAVCWADRNATAREPKPDAWRTEIDALTADDAAHPPPRDGVLFVGSS